MDMPKHPNPPGNRSWKRDQAGIMGPDLARQPSANAAWRPSRHGEDTSRQGQVTANTAWAVKCMAAWETGAMIRARMQAQSAAPAAGAPCS